MAKKETHIPAIIDTPEALETKIAAMKEAQKLLDQPQEGRNQKEERIQP